VKWETPNGPVQHTSDGRYCVQRATSEDWIAYSLSAFGTTAQKLGERKSDVAARGLCEAEEALRHVAHRRGT
jgi:hypothetical protein